MSIPDHARANFQTLLLAATSGDLASLATRCSISISRCVSIGSHAHVNLVHI